MNFFLFIFLLCGFNLDPGPELGHCPPLATIPLLESIQNNWVHQQNAFFHERLTISKLYGYCRQENSSFSLIEIPVLK